MLKKLPFSFYGNKAIRVIIDTDCHNQVDDQYCVAHALMTPQFDIRGIVAEHYGTLMEDRSQERSYEEVVKILNLMDLADEVKAYRGAEGALLDEKTPYDTEGARFIVEEALKEDDRPLYVCCIGAITNMASAYLLNPAIEDKLTVVWIGGGVYPQGGHEFNQDADIHAVNVIMKSKINLWQVPINVYHMMYVPMTGLINHIYPYGKIGKYLVEYTFEFATHTKEWMEKWYATMTPEERSKRAPQSSADMQVAGGYGSMWRLGDSPVVGILMFGDVGNYETHSAPFQINTDGTYDMSKPGSRDIRVYTDIDANFIINDMYEKFKCYFSEWKNEF